MNELFDILNGLFAGIKFKSATYSEHENACVVNFFYNPDVFTPTEESIAKINETLTSTVGNFVAYKINFISCPLDKHTIANHTLTTIINNFPAFSQGLTFDDISVEIDNLCVTVCLKLSSFGYNYVTEFDRSEMVANKLKETFMADFVVKFAQKEETKVVSNTSYIESNAEFEQSIKEAEHKTIYTLSDITNIIGRNDYSVAIDFSKVKSAIENVVICGEVTNCQKKTYKKKVKRDGEQEEIERVFYSFSIKADNRFLYCSIFPSQKDELKGEVLEPGMQICCYGSFRLYNGKLNFTAQSIARCKFKKEEIKAQDKKVNEFYHTVMPQEYVDYEQSDMFSMEEKTFAGTYVVFDLETTGLESATDEIIEFGACKIENGKITETFSSFVKPSKHIPREITELTGITDAMVKDAPTINYVLPDFFKFCAGSTMVGHNVAFDIGFIYAAARKLGYNFDNPLVDTIEMAHKKLPGLKNYKLGTVVEALHVVLDNAHRAINDATATAKVFIKLM